MYQEKKNYTDMKPIEIYNQIALFLAEEHMIAPEEKMRLLQCIREDHELCRRQ